LEAKKDKIVDISNLLKQADGGDPKALWGLALEAYHHLDDPAALLTVAQKLDEFENADDPNLLLHIAFILRKGGYLAAAHDALMELVADEYAPAMTTLGRMHLDQEFEDYNLEVGYDLLRRAGARGNLRAPLIAALHRWAAAAWYAKPYRYVIAWLYRARYHFYADLLERNDDTVR